MPGGGRGSSGKPGEGSAGRLRVQRRARGLRVAEGDEERHHIGAG